MCNVKANLQILLENDASVREQIKEIRTFAKFVQCKERCDMRTSGLRMCGCVAAFCVIWVLCSCGGKSRSAKLRLDSCGIDTTSAVVVEGDTCSVGCYLVACYVKGGSQEQQDFVNKYIALRLLAAVKNDSVSS